MNALRIVALLGAFSAAPVAAQPPSFLVINNSDRTLTCSSRFPNGLWQPWFEMKPGANWVGANEGTELQFQCRPPVAQVSYSLKPRVKYSLLPSGAEVRLVEVTQ